MVRIYLSITFLSFDTIRFFDALNKIIDMIFRNFLKQIKKTKLRNLDLRGNIIDTYHPFFCVTQNIPCIFRINSYKYFL